MPEIGKYLNRLRARWGSVSYRRLYGHQPGDGVRPYGVFENWFGSLQWRFSEWLEKFEDYSSIVLNFNGSCGGPRWDQDFFQPLDGVAAYSMVRSLQPRTIIECGWGHSTRFMAQALHDANLPTSIITIDPKAKSHLRASTSDRIVKRLAMVQEVELSLFEALQPGDILFVDSSHRSMPGSDVDFVMARVIPILEAGVILHFHDIFLPDNYPVAWRTRCYNEQPAVAALLVGGGFEVLFASHYVRTRMKRHLEGSLFDHLPVRMRHLESSLWLRKSVPRLASD